MIPCADRYARCKTSHVVNRLPVIRRAYGEGTMGEVVAYLEIFEDGAAVQSLPMSVGAVKELYKKLGEIILD